MRKFLIALFVGLVCQASAWAFSSNDLYGTDGTDLYIVDTSTGKCTFPNMGGEPSNRLASNYGSMTRSGSTLYAYNGLSLHSFTVSNCGNPTNVGNLGNNVGSNELVYGIFFSGSTLYCVTQNTSTMTMYEYTVSTSNASTSNKHTIGTVTSGVLYSAAATGGSGYASTFDGTGGTQTLVKTSLSSGGLTTEGTQSMFSAVVGMCDASNALGSGCLWGVIGGGYLYEIQASNDAVTFSQSLVDSSNATVYIQAITR